MKKSQVFLLIGCMLLVAAIVFLLFALNHPEMSFPWKNNITYTIYIIYIIAIISMFGLWIKTKKR